MKRYILFFLTNIAIIATLTIVASLVCLYFDVDLFQIDWIYPLFIFAFIFGMTGAFISLALSKSVVKWIMRCRVIDGSEGAAEQWLVSTIEDLARRANIKTPQVAIYSGQANAFATGARKNAALLAVSTGIMQQMTKEELRAVLAHEISHVSNGDMVTMSLLQGVMNTFVIFFSLIVAIVIQNAVNGDKKRRNNFAYYMILQFCQMIFGLLGSIILLWYSRKREYAADAGSASLLGSPTPMIAALERLGSLKPGVLPNSLKAFGIASEKTSIFSTHPSLSDRIEALRQAQMTGNF